MQLRNTNTVCGLPARALHLLGAVAMLILLGHGWWMTHMVPGTAGRLANYSWHAALGYDLLALTILRLLWRWWGGVPALPPDTQRWERVAAYVGHVMLYLFTFATTLVGWALAGTMRTPLTKDLYGLSWPLVYVSQDQAIHETLEDGRKILAYVLAVIIAVHVAGALRHHFIKRNNVLTRMLRPAAAPA